MQSLIEDNSQMAIDELARAARLRRMAKVIERESAAIESKYRKPKPRRKPVSIKSIMSQFSVEEKQCRITK